MSTVAGSTGAAGVRGARSGWRRLGFTVVVVAVVGIVVAVGFALAGASDGGHGGSSGNPFAGGVPPTSTGAVSADSGAAAVAAAPAVCGNLKGATVMSDGMVMAPVSNRVPGPADRSAAQKLVGSVSAGIAKYSNLSAAIADGYVPATNPNGYVVHYANWEVVRAGDVLDPNTPSSLVYANTVSGPVLLGAMFLGPAPCRPGPDVAGPLTQWHAHANLCLSVAHVVVGRSNASGQCVVGSHNTNTYFMMHVWTAPSLAQDYQFAAHVPNAVYAAIIRNGRA